LPQLLFLKLHYVLNKTSWLTDAVQLALFGDAV
jgi:hypothetical protein